MAKMVYVLGFAFNCTGTKVALIRKSRPEWQADRLNGIGGKVDPDEAFDEAMSREFREETGVHIPARRWTYNGVLRGDDFEVAVFATRMDTNEMMRLRSATDEPVIVHRVEDVLTLPPSKIIANLRWLVPLALDGGTPGAPDAGPRGFEVRY